jgi:hypothetical protein
MSFLTDRRQVWGRVGVAGSLALAVLVCAFLSAGAAPAPEPKKEEPKKTGPAEEAKKEAPKKDEGKKEEPKAADVGDLAPLDEILKNLPPGISAEQAKRMHKEMQKTMEMMRQAMPGGGFGAFPDGMPQGFPFNPFGGVEEGRLGVQLQKPSETLVDQLDLPKGQGLVIDEVERDSAAGKAGVRAHDILLEVNGKAVPSNSQELAKLLGEIKPNTPVDVVVLRKGKRETIKGVTLPEAKKTPAGGFKFPAIPPLGGGGAFGPGAFPAPAMPAMGPFGFGGGKGVMTVTFRTADRFTTRHEEGSLIITVTGTVADGKAKVNEIHIQDGAVIEKAESVDAVPERYRDKVKNLVEMSEKSAVKVEIKVP